MSQCQYLKIVLGHLKSKFISQNYKETYMTLYKTEYKVLHFTYKTVLKTRCILQAYTKSPTSVVVVDLVVLTCVSLKIFLSLFFLVYYRIHVYEKFNFYKIVKNGYCKAWMNGFTVYFSLPYLLSTFWLAAPISTNLQLLLRISVHVVIVYFPDDMITWHCVRKK